MDIASTHSLNQRAAHFRDQIVLQTQKAVPAGQPAEFYPKLFQKAAAAIETATDEFCDRADEVFDEIDAYGKEPQLDDDWLYEVTGDKDSFYFSTENLVAGPKPLRLPRKHRQRAKLQDEQAVVEAVENAISLCLRQADGELELWQLQERTGLSPGALLLALLLGQDGRWILRQDGFYGTLWVRAR